MEPERRITAEASIDFLGFMDEIYVMMRTEWGEDTPVFTMTAPDATNSKNVPMPQIIYSLVDSQPGVVGNNQTREIRPRKRESRKEISPTTLEEVTFEYFAQIKDCQVVFSIYGQSNEEVFFWASKLQSFLLEHKGYFMRKGVSNLWWLREGEPAQPEKQKDNFSKRELTYHVRLETIHRVQRETFKEINVHATTVRHKLIAEGKLPSQSLPNDRIQP